MGKVNVTALIERAVEKEAVKTVLFNGKESYKIIVKVGISNTILASATQPIELESLDFKKGNVSR